MKAKTAFKGILALFILTLVIAGTLFGVAFLFDRAHRKEFFKQYEALLENPNMMRGRKMAYWQGKVEQIDEKTGGYFISIVPVKEGVEQRDLAFEVNYGYSELPEGVAVNAYVIVTGQLEASSRIDPDAPEISLFVNEKENLWKRKKYLLFE